VKKVKEIWGEIEKEERRKDGLEKETCVLG